MKKITSYQLQYFLHVFGLTSFMTMVFVFSKAETSLLEMISVFSFFFIANAVGIYMIDLIMKRFFGTD